MALVAVAAIPVYAEARLPGIASHHVSVLDFGVVPGDGKDDSAGLRQAMEQCRQHPGSVLFMPPGVYDFRDEIGAKLMTDILTGVIPGNPQRTIFQPNYPHGKGLDFAGLEDVTLEAAGAVLLCDGWIEPISLSNCRNVKVHGLTIDYKRRPNSTGTITEVKPEWYEARFDPQDAIQAKTILYRLDYWDVAAARRLPGQSYMPKFEEVSPGVLRIFAKIPPNWQGNLVLAAHTGHFRPAVLILEAQNIELEDVTIHAQPGMGIVGHRSTNITMRGVRIVPAAGQIASVNTDATHFTSCAGVIRYENCQFEGQGDDAVNIHNYYYTLEAPVSGEGYDLVLRGADWHAQALDYPDPGDTLELVDRETLRVLRTLKVKTSSPDFTALRCRVTLDAPLPPDLANHYLINVTRLPRVRIIGCAVTGNRARGFLIKARDVVIERCVIRETTGTGIHVGAESRWHEGPASAEVVIRANRIVRCGSGPGNVGASGIAVNVEAPNQSAVGLHRNILIEGNIIEGEKSDTGILISGATEVVLRYNELAGCTIPLRVVHSRSVRAYANTGIEDRDDALVP